MTSRQSQEPDFTLATPQDDDRERRICRTCGFVDYVNPKIVAGSVVADEAGRILMCRRAIEPRKGFWTLPAGYLEEGESVEEGAQREALEEACATIETLDLLALYSIPRISQVQIFFRARLSDPHIAAGPGSLESLPHGRCQYKLREIYLPGADRIGQRTQCGGQARDVAGPGKPGGRALCV